MDQDEQIDNACPGRRCIGQQADAGHQVEVAFFDLGRCQEDLLVLPGHIREIEACGPGGKEAQEELFNELLEEYLETLIMVWCLGTGHTASTEKATPV
jgi:hypothetical protein